MSRHCKACHDGAAFPIAFSMAFQPIVDLEAGQIFAHEALVRGMAGEGAGSVLSVVTPENRYAFDQQCRVKAIELAQGLGVGADGTMLSINFMPNAVYEPRACIKLTLDAAARTGFPTRSIIFEFTEQESLDTAHVLGILRAYRSMGFKTAIDDFGAGHSGLSLLAKFQPDIVKMDMDLIRGIDTDKVRRSIIQHMVNLLHELGVTPICEGVETLEELSVLRDLGVRLIQGYVIARPTFESLASPAFPALATAA